MIRLVLLFLIVAAVLWLLKRLFSDAAEPAEESQGSDNNSENMLQCKYCGIHSPESTNIKHHDQNYCSQDHADQAQ